MAFSEKELERRSVFVRWVSHLLVSAPVSTGVRFTVLGGRVVGWSDLVDARSCHAKRWFVACVL
eukprot:5560141-Prymnesium_polylepis.1